MKELNKTIEKLRKQLNTANKVFAEQITKNTDTSYHYANIGIRYQRILAFVKKNSTRAHPALEIYKFSATLGLIQCQVNALDLSPLTEEAVKKNNDQLAAFKKEILDLFTSTAVLKEKFNLEADTEKNKDHPIKDEYITLEKQVVDYSKAWETTEFNLKAAYYYNYADYLLSKPGPASLIKKAIPYFKQSSDFYSKNDNKIAKKQTDDKIADTLTKLPVRQLQVSLNKLTSSDIQSMKHPVAINHKRAMALDAKQKNIPPKKRKINLTSQITQTSFLSNVIDGQSTQTTDAEVSSVEVPITENILRTITHHLSKLPSKSKHQFLESVLQAVLEKTQQDCSSEEPRIPIKSSNLHYQNFIDKLRDLSNLLPPPCEECKKLFNSIFFFKPKKTIFTKEIFLARLKNHLFVLKRDYVTSNKEYSTICASLTRLIINQVAQQYMTEQNTVSSTYYPKSY